MSAWWALPIFIVAQIVYGRFIIMLYQYRDRREQKKFLMFLAAKFPDTTLTFRSVSGKSEHDAFKKLVASMQGYEPEEESP